MYIRFCRSLVPCLCETLDMACREAEPDSIIPSKDDGKRVVFIKGGANSLGLFIRISEIGRNGHGHAILLPGGGKAFGWANATYILHRSFGGSVPVIEGPTPHLSLDLLFPSLPVASVSGQVSGNATVCALKCDRDWVIQTGWQFGKLDEEV